MTSPIPIPGAHIGENWSDEELFLSLKGLMCGSPLPGNVLANVNPCQYLPSDLSADMWYLIDSEKEKDTEIGFWKAKGETIEMKFKDSSIIGHKTTLEFYEGQPPHGQKTDWIMQEYRITWNGLCENSKPKESMSLCRFFFCGGQIPNNQTCHKQGSGGNNSHQMASVVPNFDNHSGQGYARESQAKSRDYNLPVEDLVENDYILSGDYLEWDDLVRPLSPSSGSHNSSCISLSSSELFDSIALLQDLDDEVNQDLPEKDESFKFNISSSVKQKELTVRPATLAYDDISPVKGATKHASTSPKAGCDGGGTPNFRHALASSTKPKVVLEGEKKAPASSTNHKVELEGGKKALRYRAKGPKRKKKRYRCFIPI